MDDGWKRSDRHQSSLEITNGLKILSNSSKYEILKLLKEGSLYGKELCKKTKVSNDFSSCFCFSIHRFYPFAHRKKRIYYSFNQKKIQAFLQQIEEELL